MVVSCMEFLHPPLHKKEKKRKETLKRVTSRLQCQMYCKKQNSISVFVFFVSSPGENCSAWTALYLYTNSCFISNFMNLSSEELEGN